MIKFAFGDRLYWSVLNTRSVITEHLLKLIAWFLCCCTIYSRLSSFVPINEKAILHDKRDLVAAVCLGKAKEDLKS